MTDATAMPSQNHHLTVPCSASPSTRPSGLLLDIVLAICFRAAQQSTVPAGFLNVARTPGERIAGNIAPNQGRTAIIACHNGVLFTVPEAPSSNPARTCRCEHRTSVRRPTSPIRSSWRNGV